MKNRIFLVFLITFLSSCEKDLSLDPLEFDVTLPKTEYKVDEDVKFDILGNADIISFYSGEVGNDYEYRNGRVLDTDLSASFSIKFKDGGQTDQLSVLVSTDLKSYSLEDINAATWTNVTDRYTFPGAGSSSSVYYPCGEADLNDLIKEGQPMYFAFRYFVRPIAIYGSYDSWEFSTFLMNYTTTLDDVILLNQTTAAWKIVLEGNWEADRVKKYTNTLRFIGNANNNTENLIAWAISAPVYASRKVDLGADPSIPIKAVADIKRTNYTHTYSAPGTYKITFVGANQNISKRIESIKQLEINVIP